MRAKRAISCACFLLCPFVLVFGCDQTFEPLQENDQYYFSIYGYLDAAADTQWVRVGPARQGIDDIPDPSGIKVTLKHNQSGKTVVMKDSLFSSQKFLNYWTTMDIGNEQTYHIKVERDGKSSEVTVTTPEELPTPLVLETGGNPAGFYVYIDDSIGHLADVKSKWYVVFNPQTEKLRREYTFTYRNTAKHTEAYGGSYFAFAPAEDEAEHIRKSSGGANMAVLHRQFFVAAGGPEWDEEISSIDDLEYFLDGTASNVENGLGYVVGIDSKWVPYETCLTPEKSAVIACPEEEPFW